MSRGHLEEAELMIAVDLEAHGDERIRRALEKAAWEYGKIGLLIDDSSECVNRVARALYGSEALPQWWGLVRSMQCASVALARISELLADSSFGSLRVFIVIDRYLPPRCGSGAIAWHGGDAGGPIDEVSKVNVSELNRRVADIMTKTSSEIESGWIDGAECLVRFVTSFPVISPRSGDAPDIVWQMRSVELLQEERRKFRESLSWKCLLRYGPETWARIAGKEPPPGWMAHAAGAARWRARTWKESLSRLASIIRGKRAILLTGAGASLSAGPAGPGMLKTGEIVHRVCRSIVSNLEEPLPKPEPAACSCREPEPVVSAPQWTGDPMPKKKTPIGRLLAGEEREFKLEEVFSPHLHLGAEEIFERFHRLFRRELYKRDFGCAYHHWLMARFPWKSVITTNFDGFHERASASVTRILSMHEEDRLWVLSLGSVGKPEDMLKGRAARGLGKSRLFKPYGSLYSPSGELALGGKDVAAFQEELEKALRVALSDSGQGDRGAVVVVGQSMRDELVKSVLENLKDELRDCELLWVDPAAYERCEKVEYGKSTVWEWWVAERMRSRDKERAVADGAIDIGEEACSGPYPAMALEFIYDLWSIYQEGNQPKA
jgi:hypothetical protein